MINLNIPTCLIEPGFAYLEAEKWLFKSLYGLYLNTRHIKRSVEFVSNLQKLSVWCFKGHDQISNLRTPVAPKGSINRPLGFSNQLYYGLSFLVVSKRYIMLDLNSCFIINYGFVNVSLDMLELFSNKKFFHHFLI